MSEIKKTPALPSAEERALRAAQIIADNKGTDIRILDLREVTQVFDFFVIASGTSRRQLHAISDEIDEVFEKELGDRRRGLEGYQESRWIVVDYGDVVVHLFEPEKREFYALDELWGNGREIPFNSPPTVSAPASPTPESSEGEGSVPEPCTADTGTDVPALATDAQGNDSNAKTEAAAEFAENIKTD